MTIVVSESQLEREFTKIDGQTDGWSDRKNQSTVKCYQVLKSYFMWW
jgi:hypothetical protein